MSSNGCGQIHKSVELLKLTCPHNRQQAFDGALALFAAGAKHDLPPLHRGPERAFGGGMPRAGLCRVVEFAPINFEFHLGADAA